MRSGWRLEAAIREGVANAHSSGWRTVALGLGIGVMLGALAWAELSFSSEVKDLAQRFGVAGGYVAIIEGPVDLDAGRCEELRWHQHVMAAGGWRNGGDVTAAHAPGTPFQRFEVTGGIVEVWNPNDTLNFEGGYLVGRAAATELGLRAGSWVSLDSSPATSVVVIDPALRNPFAARAFIDLVPASGRVEQCWVELSPEIFDAALIWLPAQFAQDEGKARRLIDRGQFAIDPVELFAGRPHRWGWVPVTGVGVAMIALMALFRRSDTAVYRAYGLSRTGLLVMQEVETSLVVGLSYVVAVAWAGLMYALIVGIPGADQILIALQTSATAALSIIALAPVAATLAASGAPAALLKER